MGFIGAGANGDYFLVSCYHVLGRAKGSMELPQDAEQIWQSSPEFGGQVVALTKTSMMNADFDIAAASILPDVPVCANILRLGRITGVAPGAVGTRVFKFGAETGFTEGEITEVDARLVEIEALPESSEDSVLCSRGDSGALWVNAAMEAIGVHFQGRDKNTAYARPMDFVLSALGLTLLTNDTR